MDRVSFALDRCSLLRNTRLPVFTVIVPPLGKLWVKNCIEAREFFRHTSSLMLKPGMLAALAKASESDTCACAMDR